MVTCAIVVLSAGRYVEMLNKLTLQFETFFFDEEPVVD